MVTVTTSLVSCSPWLPADSGSGGIGLTCLEWQVLLVSKDAYMRCAAAAHRCATGTQRMWLDVAMRCDGCGWM
jgi:hypothetical protein